MLAPFAYFSPGSVSEALELLAHEPDAVPYAGGVTLVPRLRAGAATPRTLVDLKGIASLRDRELVDGKLRLGALTTHAVLQRDRSVGAAFPELAEMAAAVGSVQVRSRGTIGGNLGAADRAYDVATVALALDARVELEGAGGTRRVAIDELIPAYGETCCRPDELILGLEVPVTPSTGSYVKFRRSALEPTIVGVAVAVELGTDGACRAARVVLGGYSAAPARATSVEALLIGTPLRPVDVASASDALDELEPTADRRAGARYRRRIAAVLLEEAVARASARPGRARAEVTV